LDNFLQSFSFIRETKKLLRIALFAGASFESGTIIPDS
jgi:hypothetical protein